MKLNDHFISHKMNDSCILIPGSNAGFSGVVKGNGTLGVILELLKSETTREQIISVMKERFNAPEGAIEKDVDRALSELRGIGALDE